MRFLSIGREKKSDISINNNSSVLPLTLTRGNITLISVGEYRLEQEDQVHREVPGEYGGAHFEIYRFENAAMGVEES